MTGLRYRCLLVVSMLLIMIGQATQAMTLDQQEMAYLQQHGPLRVGLIVQAPYVYLDKPKTTLSGLHIEWVQQLAQQMKQPIRWYLYPNEAQLMAAVQQGKIDLTPSLEQTPEALKHWRFSDPFLRIPYKLLGRSAPKAIVELEQLSNHYRIAVPTPSNVSRFLSRHYPHLDQLAVNSERDALQALLNQQAYYAVIDEAQRNLLLGEPAFSALHIVADTGATRLLRLASAQEQPTLARILDRALNSLSSQQRKRLYHRWIAPEASGLSQRIPIWRWLTYSLLALLAVLLLFCAWQGQQQRAQRQRIKQLKQALDQGATLEEALQLTRSSVDLSTVGILWLNWDSRIRYANQAALSMLTYSSSVLLGQPLAQIEPKLDMDHWLALWGQVRQQALVQIETQCLCGDGQALPVEITFSFLRHQHNEYLVAFLTDVTEKHRARAVLEESEARFKGMAANVPGVVFRLERSSHQAPPRLAFISEASLALTGYSAASLQAQTDGLQSLIHPADLAHYQDSRQQALQQATHWYWQGRIVTQSGEVRWADLKASLRYQADHSLFWDGILWDITANKENELQLAASQAQLRDLSAHLETVREEEKAHIAREVHDELGQVLTVLKLETAMLTLQLAQPSPAQSERLNNIKQLIDQTFALVRDVATALRPPILNAGLGSAIDWQAKRFEARTGIPCLVLVPEYPIILDDAKAIGLFRILQEALTNIMRHAQADTVTLNLQAQSGQLQLSIQDDGQGFIWQAHVRGPSYGLVGMQERVLMLGGQLSINTAPGQGCHLAVTIPLQQHEGEQKHVPK